MLRKASPLNRIFMINLMTTLFLNPNDGIHFEKENRFQKKIFFVLKKIGSVLLLIVMLARKTFTFPSDVV